MTTATLNAPSAAAQYTEEDHGTWAILYREQLRRVEHCAPAAFWRGLPQLALDPQRLPDCAVFSARLHGLSGWTLADAQNAYLGPTEWFEHLAARRFPVTDYIRPRKDLDFTPMPDLFHEYFGHLAYFTDARYGEMAQLFGVLYLSAQSERQQLEIARLWWYSTEFGFIREGGALKTYGAGLLSSIGELAHALRPETPKLPFDIDQVAETPGAAYSMHSQYFILDDEEHPHRIIHEYAAREGLPTPRLP
jgi:phenylalanine-4-hydroxylase